MEKTEIQKRVAEGAAFLDKNCPDWENRINLDRLDISSWDWCVLGQLYGDYDIGVDCLKIADDRRWNFGFTRIPKQLDDFGKLTATWKCEISARCEKKTKVVAKTRTRKTEKYRVAVIASIAISILILCLACL